MVELSFLNKNSLKKSSRHTLGVDDLLCFETTVRAAMLVPTLVLLVESII